MRCNELRAAARLVRRKVKWTLICAYFDHRYTEDEICDALDRERMRDRARREKRIARIRENFGFIPSVSIVPDSVIKDRDYRVNHVHPELAGRIFGDPLPEYSALAKRGNRVHHHPLSAQRT